MGAAVLALSDAAEARPDDLAATGMDAPAAARQALASAFFAWCMRHARRRAGALPQHYDLQVALAPAGEVLRRGVRFDVSDRHTGLGIPKGAHLSSDSDWWRAVVCAGIATAGEVLVLAAERLREATDSAGGLWRACGLRPQRTAMREAGEWRPEPVRGYIVRAGDAVTWIETVAGARRTLARLLAAHRRAVASALLA